MSELTQVPWYAGTLVLNAHIVYSSDEKTVVVICRNATDASMIAASPDMFHALHQCIEALETVSAEALGVDLFLDQIRTAHLALKKAQGAA